MSQLQGAVIRVELYLVVIVIVTASSRGVEVGEVAGATRVRAKAPPPV